MLSIEDFRAGRPQHNLPLIVDAAAEEDLTLGRDRRGYGDLQRRQSL
jgi:hypothetical protein